MRASKEECITFTSDERVFSPCAATDEVGRHARPFLKESKYSVWKLSVKWR